MKKVIAAGHICLDITPVFEGGPADSVEQLLSPGKLIRTGKADVHTGGSVANTGLAMKLLGADVSLMGKIGKDEFGDMIRKMLKEYDADEGMLTAEGESTSYSVILAIPGIDRIVLHNPGANDTFCAEDIPEQALKNCTLFHFGYPTLMKRMYENEGEELLRILKKAKEAGAATSLDFALVNKDTDAGKADWELILEKIMPYVDFFLPSVEELCFMLDKDRLALWQKRAKDRDLTDVLDIKKDVTPLAEQCISFGAKVVLIKCGAPGMYYRTANYSVLSKISAGLGLDISGWHGKEGFERSYAPERVLSAIGAGDASIAAFLASMLKGYSLEDTVHLAAAAGASCVAAYDALSGLKPLGELEEKIKAGWKKRGIHSREND